MRLHDGDGGEKRTVGMTPDAASQGEADAGSSSACDDGSELPLAQGLTLRQLALYQTVKLSLYERGAWQPPTDVPIVAGKKTLLRAFVETAAGYSPHAVRAVLKLHRAQGETILQDEKSLAVGSTDAALESTFTFTVDGTLVAPDTQLSVSLHETRCSASAGSAQAARLPAAGLQPLGAQAVGKLRVVIVPINVDGRLPATDEVELTRIREALLAYYPVAEVDLRLRTASLAWTGPVPTDDTDKGWSDILDEVRRARRSDEAEDDVYYFGVMQPAASLAAFCSSSCVLGIAPQTTRVFPTEQVGLGAYFTDRPEVARGSAETVVHELGHAHGRGHAPCVRGGTITGVDGSFPDPSGATGEWGWDSRAGTLIPPTHKDMMGYCSPDWISPYTYAALAERSRAVNTLALVHGAPMLASWHSVLLYRDGSARWGGVTESKRPQSDGETATVLDASGRVITTIEVFRIALSHSLDQNLYLPTGSSDWAAVVLSDRTLQLGRIEPPL